MSRILTEARQMALLLKDGFLLDMRGGVARPGSLLVADGQIVRIDPSPEDYEAAEIVDCSGKLVMPALVNGHTHLYSALALGMPAPVRNPASFVEILELVWWRLDSLLDERSIMLSALAGAARAALCGCATVVDHHASPNAIAGSLDLVREGIEKVGLRGVLCYEVTDRHGLNGAQAGIKENARFLSSIGGNQKFAGMVGAHASFTLGDESLQAVGQLAREFGVGVHIHCGEDLADVAHSRNECGMELVERLQAAGVLRSGTLLAHCTNLDASSVAKALESGCWLAHNPRSNMNNAVGYAPVAAMDSPRLILGTDGIDSDLFSECRTAYLKTRDAKASAGMESCARWATAAADFASHCLGVRLGRLSEGNAADIVLLEYDGFTPVTGDNLLGHWFFGFASRHVHSLLVGGKWIVRNRKLTSGRAKTELEDCAAVAARLWRAMQ